MSAPTVAPLNGGGAQYAGKKRRRPQPKKDKDSGESSKSNPSKRHRDRLNSELDHLAKLIPFPEEVINKLDKLSILRLAVAYLRNKSYYTDVNKRNEIDHDPALYLSNNTRNEVPCFSESESELSLMAINGFIIVVPQDFNIFYVSETVQEYLGFPQCDVMNQSMLDLIHAEDRDLFTRQMYMNPKCPPKTTPPVDGETPQVPEYTNHGLSANMFKELSRNGMLYRSFICRLRCLLDNSSGFLALHFTGHLRLIPGQNRRGEQNILLPPEQALFLYATPLQSPSILEIRTKNFIFRTKHKLDYTPLGVDAKGKIVLGYTEQQLRQRSGYEFVHSADMMHCADAHTKLMRKGESGLTVFRLLHKNNKWIWVTASARLVFRNNRPDYIISTHRPIPDQEGEEHMKKRTNAFRFDFTGQAILYGDVNPIGTGGGPEKNPIKDNDQPGGKRPRYTNNVDSPPTDRMTLYGAQSMQRMDIYVGNLPNQTNEVFCNNVSNEEAIKQEQIELALLQDNGPLTNTSDIVFYPMGTEVPPENQHPRGQIPLNNGLQQDHMFQNPNASVPAQYPVEPPRLYHPPVNNQNTEAHGYHEPQPNDNYSGNPLKRPYQACSKMDSQASQQWNTQAQTQTQNWVAQKQMVVGGMQHTAKHEQDVSPTPFPNFQQEAQVNDANVTNMNLYFQPNANHNQQAGPQGYEKYPVHSNPNEPSVMDALSIKSMMKTVDYGPGQSCSNEDNLNWNSPQLIGYQDNTVQFDLQKIARDFQTTNPMSQVQQYIERNPAHAMAIATGNMPESGMPKLHSDKVKVYMPSCQYSQSVPDNGQMAMIDQTSPCSSMSTGSRVLSAKSLQDAQPMSDSSQGPGSSGYQGSMQSN
uniref:Transcription factor protein n=1 Tax=Ciona intestinalis TaxID=7719 RepID=Q4H3X2_CIOIN|nr:transcription factor protein [Ciona intestinalis]BAE06305.1 transcription factor protein [Ciona intestinalis]|eukprot:NP_001071651.1 transcription factor protein [Ciona intestinalis]